MNRKILLALLLVFVVMLSINSIQASDVNATNSSATNSMDVNVQLDSAVSSELSNGSSDVSNETSKNQTELTSPTTSIYYKGSYDVTLIDSNTNATLVNKTVNFVINDVNYTANTDDNGVASVNLSLNPGKYVSTAYFGGDDDYAPSNNLTSTFTVLSTIKASNLSKYYKGSTKYAATFYNSQGTVLSNRSVNIRVNGKSYSKQTDGDGVVSLSIDLKPGTYKVISTNPDDGYTLTTTFKILSTISSSSMKKVAGDSKKFSAKFLKSNGKPLANKYVKIKLKGKTYKVKTNSKGKATLSLKKLKKGTYKVVCYNTDSLSKTYTIKVYKIASTKLSVSSVTFRPTDSKKIKIKFSTGLDDSSKSGKVIKIKINGKTYSKKTDSNGIVNFKLPSLKAGVYAVEYKFKGNKFFKDAKANKLVTILKNDLKTKIKVKSTKSFGYGAGTLLKVAYVAGGVPLAKRTVTLKIDGKTYKRTTDKKGIASVKINMKIGSYTVNYKTSNESKINGTSGSFEIKVFKRSGSKIIWKVGSSFKDSSQVFKVRLTDKKGHPISGKKIKLTIDGKTYSSTTNSKGYAKFKTSVPIGKYKISLKFGGNNNYLSSSKSKTINVKLSKFGKGINEKNSISYLKAYLKSSNHCKVGTAKLKALVKSLTKGLKNKIDKAKAIYNFVRDEIKYSYYYDSHKGSTGTLKSKKGNCADQANLLVALFRTAGFKARYVHGTCHFKSGLVTGHVWAQVLIDKTWVCADPTSGINDLGRIKSWNTKSYTLHGKYSSIPF